MQWCAIQFWVFHGIQPITSSTVASSSTYWNVWLWEFFFPSHLFRIQTDRWLLALSQLRHPISMPRVASYYHRASNFQFEPCTPPGFTLCTSTQRKRKQFTLKETVPSESSYCTNFKWGTSHWLTGRRKNGVWMIPTSSRRRIFIW